jgi:N,N'-diacetyllegionaminate synthase
MLSDLAGRCLIIAEVAQNHDGSLGTAHAYIDAVARTGANVVKFQTHIADAESTPDEPWRVKFSRQDKSRFEYWKRMEFSEDQWQGLADHARDKGLSFMSSAFSIEAVELLERVGVPAWKVGAGEVTNIPMIERMAQTGKPVMLSSGLSTWADLDQAVATVRQLDGEVGLFQCTTSYPCPPEKLGLNVMAELRDRYKCPVGLSDHSGTIFAGLAAATLGARLLEVHVTLSRECFGPDVPSSITTGELKQLVDGVRFIEAALTHPIDKQTAAVELQELRTIFGKSVVAARDLPAGRRLSLDDLAVRKPGNGIPAARMKDLVSRTLTRSISRNAFLAEDDFE